jgi:glyoxylase-like metal-dependent hydrolase (beta-lactamase superfamily II)
MQESEQPTGATAAVSPMQYEVMAIRYGSLHTRKSELFYRYEAYHEPDAEIDMDYFFWVLKGGGRTILVDTGFDPAVGTRRGRKIICPPVEALEGIGVPRASVTTIVVTHLHYDHIGNLRAFPNAEITVQRREIEFWSGPCARRFQFACSVEPAEIDGVMEAERHGRVRIVDGSAEILRGVQALCVGGHSPGQQLTVVDAVGGRRVVLASDAVHFYEEWLLDRPFAVLADLAQMYGAYDLLKAYAREGSVIVPGHDPEVLRRFPPLSDDVADIAVRVA